jgi:biopolymer transport protein ExbB
MITSHLPLAFLLTNEDGSPMSLLDLFYAGHEIMWPILLLSFVGITVIVERLLFIIRENASREPEVVEKMLEAVERRDVEGALEIGKKSNDAVARILVYSLANREYSLSNAFIRASSLELGRFQQGMATLDTVITAAPLLGLLGTVTGMMRTFAALNGGGGGNIGDAAGKIVGGVAEALIATCCGLFIAVLSLLPYNYLNARAEQAKNEISDASHALEILMKKAETMPPFAR